MSAAAAARPIFRRPTVSKSDIVFDYAGDLWIVSRQGGEAHRLTDGVGRKIGPYFSPDGTQIAFTREHEGSASVFVMPVLGGEPRRLAYHPSPSTAVGWSPDGKNVLFSSSRERYTSGNRLYTIGVDGSFPDALPLPMAETGCYSPDGAKIAFTRVRLQSAWKRYRGGRTSKLWFAALADSSVVSMSDGTSNDFNPMWVGEKIYFLSDRNGPISLFAYDLLERTISEIVKNDGLDFKSASAGPGAIVYEQFGAIYLYDLQSQVSHAVAIQAVADSPEVRPRFEKLAATKIENAGLSPEGERAVFEAHGNIFTVPAEQGHIQTLTNSPGVANRDPAWSPDGKFIAYFSDESGEYELHLQDLSGPEKVQKLNLGNPPSFFYTPIWSPDSRKIAYTDKRHKFWYVDLATRTPVHIDSDLYDGFPETMGWSPDSRWLAYSKQLLNGLHAVMVYSLEEGKSSQLTDGMSDALAPAFDRCGKYLYFLASTDVGPASAWQDMSSMNRPVTSQAYVAILRKNILFPLGLLSEKQKPSEVNDKEKAGGGDPERTVEKNRVFETSIDFDNISQRILALPVPGKNYFRINSERNGVLYLQEKPLVEAQSRPTPLSIWKFDCETRQMHKILEDVTSFLLSENGEKMLFQRSEEWTIAPVDISPAPGDGALRLSDMEVYVDPRAEWRQMYHEAWRLERDFFYDPRYHGLNLKAAEEFYEPYLQGVATRDDLTYLFEEMLGNLSVGHIFVRGDHLLEIPQTKVGLLGADYRIENGRYRFSKVFSGESWNPEVPAPLVPPDVNVVAGEYLLAVQGQALSATENIYRLFQDTAGKQIAIKVGPDPNGGHSREVTVIPVESETGLRYLDWAECNRRKVDQFSHGSVAYLHLPDTGASGYNSFNRYFFAQLDRRAIVLDLRYNRGGHMPDYIIDYLNRRPMTRIATREGRDLADPMQAIYGPKVMIINEFTSSGGEAMAWYFRQAGLGPLVGMRTWGGLVAISEYPPLIDGGSVTAPRWAFYGMNGKWEVENHGIAPDIEIDLDPKAVREGHDPQLERAVAVALELIKKNPEPEFPRPPYPDYGQNPLF